MTIQSDITLKPKISRKKLIILCCASVLGVALIVILSFTGYRIYEFTHSIFKSNGLGNDITSLLPIKTSAYSSDINKSLAQGKTINILLLGYGGAGHDGAYLTDSIMVASINPKEKNIALISIPRDLWVKIPISASYGSYGKINSAYEIGLDNVNYQDRADIYKGTYGGGNMAKAVVSQVIGQPIDYYVGVDFNAFSKVINDLGGIDLNVDHPFDDYQYPSGDNTTDGPPCYAPMNTPTNCQFWHVHFNPGEQHMDGETALEYARSRHALGSEGSDFARSERQQEIIVAVKNKALQANALPQIFNIMSSLQGNVQTDLTVGDIKDLTSVKSWDLSNIAHLAITDANYLISSYSTDGQYILLPRDGQGVYTQINKAVANIWNLADIQKEMLSAKVAIQNASGSNYLFNSAVSTINSDGITTITLPIAPTRSTVIYDYANGKYSATLKDIQSKIGGVIQTTHLPENPSKSDIVIIVGNDYTIPSTTQ